MPTALVSVSDKTGLDKFAKELHSKHGYKFIATTSTAKFLTDQGVECIKVADVTQFPEILGGRVKTLHPRIFAGILSRDLEEDRKTLEEMKIDELDMVIVNLYPFEKKLEENLSEDEMVEQIDIGGVALLRASAKNFQRVAIASDPDQYGDILKQLGSDKGLTKNFRRKLAFNAFSRTMNYDNAISTYFKSNLSSKSASTGRVSLPPQIDLSLNQHMALRYGENPHQAAIWYSQSTSNGTSLKWPPFNQLQGKELSSNNIVDTYALVTIMRDLKSPAVCIIKHNNPCGVAIGSTLEEALDKAHETDPVSAFGGIFGFTEKLEAPLVEKILKGFIEIVAAPSFSDEALALLKKKKNVRVLELSDTLLKPASEETWHAKDLKDFGWILERAEAPQVEATQFECVSGANDESVMRDVEFAWNVVRHLTSNAIFIAKDGQSLGFGIGQTSRIASVNIALEQAGEKANGAVLASDAFFPATDNIEAAAKAGIKVIVQPGGSIKDKDVIQACKDNNITMLLTGQRCFKH